MVTSKQFLEYSDIELANLQVTNLDELKVNDSQAVNEELLELNETETVSGLSAISNKIDNSDKPKIPSKQPHNEALFAVSGTSVDSLGMNSMYNAALAFHADTDTSIEASAAIDETQLDVNRGIINENADGMKTVATALQHQANLKEKVNGNTYLDAAANLKITSRSTDIASSGVVNVQAPVKNENFSVSHSSTNQSFHLSNYISKTTNQEFANYIDGKTELSGENLTVVRGTATEVATNIKKDAVEKIENLATDVITAAGQKITQVSKGTQTIAAFKELGMEAGDIAITAASTNPIPTDTNPTDADGDILDSTQDTLETLSPVSGNITISSSSNIPIGGQINLRAKNLVESADIANINLGVDIFNIAQGQAHTNAKVTINASEAITYNYSNGPIVTGNSQQAIYQLGRLTWIGRSFAVPVVVPTVSATPLKFIKVPPRPKLPATVTYSKLDKCIPSKYKQRKEEAEDEQSEENKNASEANQNVVPKPNDVTRENEKPIPQAITQNTVDIKNRTGEEQSTSVTDLEQSSSDGNQEGTNLPFSLASEEGGIIRQSGNQLTRPNTVGSPNIYLPKEENSNQDPFGLRQDGDSLDGPENITDEVIKGQLLDNSLLALADSLINEVTTASVFEAASTIGFNGNNSSVLSLANDLSLIKTSLRTRLLNDSEGLDPIAQKYTDAIVLNIMNQLVLELTVKLSIGGTIFAPLVNAYSQVKETVNVVASEVNDVLDSVNGVIRPITDIYNEVRGLPFIGDLGIWSAVDPVISNANSGFGAVFNLVKNFTGDPTENFANKLEELLETELIRQGLSLLTQSNIELTEREAREIGNLLILLNKTVRGTTPNIANTTQTIEEQVESQGSRQTRPNNRLDTTLDIAAITTRIIAIVGDDNKAFLIMDSLEPVIRAVRTGNISQLLTSNILENLLAFIIGPANAALLGDIQDIYKTGKTLYEAILVVPGLLHLMNEYKMPPLTRVGTLLKCLDLVNKVSNTVDAVSNLVTRLSRGGQADTSINGEEVVEDLSELITLNPSTVVDVSIDSSVLDENTQQNQISPYPNFEDIDSDTPTKLPRYFFTNEDETKNPYDLVEVTEDNCRFILAPEGDRAFVDNPQFGIATLDTAELLDLIKDLPRLTQIFNSIKELPTESIVDYEGLDLSLDQINSIKSVEIVTDPGDEEQCFTAPKLNFIEAMVRVLEIHKGRMLFEIPNIALLNYNNKFVKPSIGNFIDIRIESFLNNKNGNTLGIKKDREFYTPNVYTFQIVEYDLTRNIGLASLVPTQSVLYLEGVDQVTYSYDVIDIGTRLQPIIQDSYLTL